jgi:serine/threonine protein kinase
MASLIQSIQWLHSLNIIHRDLKLQNIILKSNKLLHECVVIDFNLATKLSNIKHIYYRCGSPGYIAPEVIK